MYRGRSPAFFAIRRLHPVVLSIATSKGFPHISLACSLFPVLRQLKSVFPNVIILPQVIQHSRFTRASQVQSPSMSLGFSFFVLARALDQTKF
jgi:hypothetical protein